MDQVRTLTSDSRLNFLNQFWIDVWRLFHDCVKTCPSFARRFRNRVSLHLTATAQVLLDHVMIGRLGSAHSTSFTASVVGSRLKVVCRLRNQKVIRHGRGTRPTINRRCCLLCVHCFFTSRNVFVRNKISSAVGSASTDRRNSQQCRRRFQQVRIFDAEIFRWQVADERQVLHQVRLRQNASVVERRREGGSREDRCLTRAESVTPKIQQTIGGEV